jgi:hypothetical protein
VNIFFNQIPLHPLQQVPQAVAIMQILKHQPDFYEISHEGCHSKPYQIYHFKFIAASNTNRIDARTRQVEHKIVPMNLSSEPLRIQLRTSLLIGPALGENEKC